MSSPLIRRKVTGTNVSHGYRGHMSVWVTLACGHHQQWKPYYVNPQKAPKTTICLQCTRQAREQSSA